MTSLLMREEKVYFSAVVATWTALGNTNAVLSFVMAVTLENGIVILRRGKEKEESRRKKRGGGGGYGDIRWRLRSVKFLRCMPLLAIIQRATHHIRTRLCVTATMDCTGTVYIMPMLFDTYLTKHTSVPMCFDYWGHSAP